MIYAQSIQSTVHIYALYSIHKYTMIRIMYDIAL